MKTSIFQKVVKYKILQYCIENVFDKVYENIINRPNIEIITGMDLANGMKFKFFQIHPENYNSVGYYGEYKNVHIIEVFHSKMIEISIEHQNSKYYNSSAILHQKLFCDPKSKILIIR